MCFIKCLNNYPCFMYVDHIENDILSNMLSTSNKDVVIIIII